MTSTPLRALKDEKTEHLMWFVEHGFHQMAERREAAKKELAERGVNVKKLAAHQCLCNQCKVKQSTTV
jgi:hypothetical protein